MASARTLDVRQSPYILTKQGCVSDPAWIEFLLGSIPPSARPPRADAVVMPAGMRPRVRLQRGGLACEEAVMPFHPTRRGVLGALAAAGFAFDDAFAQPLSPTSTTDYLQS